MITPVVLKAQKGHRTARFPISTHRCSTLALIDTGATRSCVSWDFVNMMKPKPKLSEYRGNSLISATGTDLRPRGEITIDVNIGKTKLTDVTFTVCSRLKDTMIIGLDTLKKHRLGIFWEEDRMCLEKEGDDKIVINSVAEGLQSLLLKTTAILPPRTSAVVPTVPQNPIPQDTIFELKKHPCLEETHPDLQVISMIHFSGDATPHTIPINIINPYFHSIQLNRGTTIGDLHIQYQEDYPQKFDEVGEVLEERLPATPANSKLLTSPADISQHQKVKFPNAEIEDSYRKELEELCEQYSDVFSKDASDIGHTKLITMEIPTGDSPPLAQKPYHLPLKHLEWVANELEELERAGVIQRSVSPWASPIVIVPKRSEEGKPPQKRLCVDYRLLNSLLPPVTKGLSRAKGVLTLVPLPKIDQLYGRLGGAKFFTSLDMRAGYHHIGLSPDAQMKTAFVTQFGKYEYVKCPFGLAQAPAYFQEVVLRTLQGLHFCFGYLDDILIFSKTKEEHLDHIKQVFDRLRKAGLKLKFEKCDFFRKHLYYLGHMVSDEGIQAMPNKIESMNKMPTPSTVTEIRQFLGLTGYYRKFVPHYADVTRPMTHLTKKGVPFKWTDKCEEAFQYLKEALTSSPILVYPDPCKPYVMFTDASKYAWASVLTQEYEEEIEGDRIKILKPIQYLSGLFHGSQVNWATLTKEAFAIYRSVTKNAYYLDGAFCTIMTDHKPIKNFLERKTNNPKVNNWAVELSCYQLKVQFISGKKNTLADAFSRLIEKEIAVKLEPEKDGMEFGYFAFDEEEPIKIGAITNKPSRIIIGNQTIKPGPNAHKPNLQIDLKSEELFRLQKDDPALRGIMTDLLDHQGTKFGKDYGLDPRTQIMYKKSVINERNVKRVAVPRVLVPIVLHQGHDLLGHNGTPRTYQFLRQQFWWKGLRVDVDKYVKTCLKCQQHNVQPQGYAYMHLKVPNMPMKFISMDLIGDFLTSSKGNVYALTAIDMLSNYAWCIPIPNKRSETVLEAYLKNIYAKFGGSLLMLTDNGSEFISKIFKKVLLELGTEQIFSSPHHPQGNGRIENFHRFLKACISKMVNQDMEWDDVTDLATASYNFMPNTQSKESAHYLMFGRDPITNLTKLLLPSIRYAGDERGLLQLDVLRGAYALAAHNLKVARERQKEPFSVKPEPHYKVGDLVLLRNYGKTAWEPKYLDSYRVIEVQRRQLTLEDKKGRQRKANIKDIRHQYPVDDVLRELPDAQMFGRSTKYFIHPRNLPDLKWKLVTKTLPDDLDSYKCIIEQP